MKDNTDLGKNGKVIYIPRLYYESMEVLLYEVCRIVMAQLESRISRIPIKLSPAK